MNKHFFVKKKALVTELESAQSEKQIYWRFSVKSASFLSGGLWLLSLGSVAYAEVPVPCGGGKCAGVSNFVDVGKAKLVNTGKPNQLVVQQLSDKAVLNWKSFNISSDAKVIFDQNSSTAVALNRIYQGSPSKILGELRANGQVYLINPRGIMFGKGAKVNTSSLVASTLDISNETFLSSAGLSEPSKSGKAAFKRWEKREGSDVEADDKAVISLEAGSVIETADGGQVLVLAPEIVNGGEIRTNQSGQAILAAATDEVYLTPGQSSEGTKILLPADESDLRGFLVEVKTGGKVTNNGKIFSDRGNVTLAGATINQNGIVRATTSVSLNGSVILKAQDQYQVTTRKSGDSNIADATRAGNVTLGKNSKTETVNVYEATDEYTADKLEAFLKEKAIDEQTQPLSTVAIKGKKIHIQSNAQVKATGGLIDVVASKYPSETAKASVSKEERLKRDADVRVQVDSGAVLDASGADATLEMSRNVLEVQLYSNELKDSPLQRDGALKGKKVYIDIRKGTELADISSSLKTIQKGLDERTSYGGAVSLVSDGDVVTQAGSLIDVSGGVITYKEGLIRESLLLQGNKLVPISEATADQVYDGLAGAVVYTSKKWGEQKVYGSSQFNGLSYLEGTYQEGHDAGSVQIAGRGMVLGGDLKAETLQGKYQRDLDTKANGGQLYIGKPVDSDIARTADNVGANASEEIRDFIAQTIEVVDESNKNKQRNLSIDDALLDEESRKLQLSLKPLQNAGFSQFSLSANEEVKISAAASALKLGEKSYKKDPLTHAIDANKTYADNLQIQAPLISFERDIEGFGSVLNATASVSATHPLYTDRKEFGLRVHDGVDFNFAGKWLNDNPILVGPNPLELRNVDGGAIALTTKDAIGLELNVNTIPSQGELKGNRFIVDGGVARSSTGKLSYGKAGSISLSTAAAKGAVTENNGAKFSLGESETNSEGLAGSVYFSGVSGFGKQGGSLTLNLPSITIDDHAGSVLATDANGIAHVDDSLFSAAGFSKFNLAAVGGELKFADGVDIFASQVTREINENVSLQASGAYLSEFSVVRAVRPDLVTPFTLAFSLKDDKRDTVGNADFVVKGASENDKIIIDAGLEGNISFKNERGGLLYLGNAELDAQAGSITLASRRRFASEDYNPALAVVLGHGSELNAQGGFKPGYDTLGRNVGSVLDAGSVNLLSDGFVVTEGSSTIDVSGSKASVDLVKKYVEGSRSPYAEDVTLYGNAGKVAIKSAEGFVWDGELRAATESAADAKAGSFEFSLRRGSTSNVGDNTTIYDSSQFASGLPVSDGKIVLKNSHSTQLPKNLDWQNKSQVAKNLVSGYAEISSEQIKSAGFASVEISNVERLDSFSAPKIALEDGLNFKVPYELKLNTGNISVNAADFPGKESHATLTSQYLRLSGANVNVSPELARGTLSLNAESIDLKDKLVFSGVNKTYLNAQHDIRLSGGVPGAQVNLIAPGLIDFTARQLTVDSFAHYGVIATSVLSADEALLAKGQINIHSNGNDSIPVNSAYGSLTLAAESISQDGVVKAPHGHLMLDAERQLFDSSSSKPISTGKKGNLVLGDGSITSVSGEGQTVLFGSLAGDDWLYSDTVTSGSQTIFYGASSNSAPDKGIELQGADVKLKKGAVVDLSGGGEVRSWEFIAGPGGSTDILTSPGAYAILPAEMASTLPQNLSSFDAAGLHYGDSIHLAGTADLAAGDYVLLPARYALLPGAKLIKPVTGYSNLAPGSETVRADGTPVVLGRRFAGGIYSEQEFSAYQVLDSDAIHARSEYREETARSFLGTMAKKYEMAIPDLAQDAGKITIQTERALSLGAVIKNTAPKGGRAGQADIVADHLAVVNEISKNSTGEVHILASDLNNLGVSSLMLGGVRDNQRTVEHSTSVLSSKAETVRLDNGVALSGNEIILTAKADVILEKGASIDATSNSDTKNSSDWKLIDDGALLAMSSFNINSFTRSTSSSGPAGALHVQAGSKLSASQAAVIDTNGEGKFAANLKLKAGSIYLGSDKVSLGEGTSNSEMALTGNLLNLSNIGRTTIRANELSLGAGVDFLAKDLVLNVGTFNGAHAQGQSAGINANTILFENLTNTPAATGSSDASASGATLNVTADSILLGKGAVSATQLEQINFVAHDSMRVTGNGRFVAGDANVSINAPLMGTTASGLYKLTTAGDFTLTSDSQGVLDKSMFGGKLGITADKIEIDGHLAAAGGIFELMATGADGISLTDRAFIDVSGTNLNFASTQVAVDGGAVRLTAQQGDINAAEKAVVDVSGGDKSAAGSLALNAPAGTLNWDGNVIAGHSKSASGGSVKLDVNSLGSDTSTEFNALLADWQTAGFTQQWDVRIRDADLEDLTLSSAASVKQFTLSTDKAHLMVNADINTSGASGGDIRLNGGSGLTVNSKLSATATTGEGGDIVLNAGAGSLALTSTSRLDTAGKTAEQNGRIYLRAHQNETFDDLAVEPITGALVGAKKIFIEANRIYRDTLDFSQFKDDAAAFVTHIGEIKQRLGINSLENSQDFVVAPSIEVRSESDLNLDSAVDFASWKFDVEGTPNTALPINLTIRTTGNLNINASLSDGFARNTSTRKDGLLTNWSASYALVAGSDLNSANALDTQNSWDLPELSGNMAFADNVLVRSGTGNISIAAAGDILWAGENANIYVAGRSANLERDRGLTRNRGNRWVPVDGGDLTVRAGGSIASARTEDSTYSATGNWLQTEGYLATSNAGEILPGWSIDYTKIKHDLVAAGGGDLTVAAGGDISRISMAAVSTAVGTKGSDVLTRYGKGDLSVHSGGDIISPYVTVGDGNGNIISEGNISSGFTVLRDESGKGVSVGALFEQQGGSITAVARGALSVSEIANPNLRVSGAITSPSKLQPISSYQDTSAIKLTALGGDLRTHLESSVITSIIGEANEVGEPYQRWTPGITRFVSANGNLIFSGDSDTTAAPSVYGDTAWLAAGDIRIEKDFSFLMNDNAEALPSVTTAIPTLNNSYRSVFLDAANYLPNVIVARDGNIVSGSRNYGSFAKDLNVFAAGKIENFSLNINHIQESDVSTITAGDDIQWLPKNYYKGGSVSKDGGISVAGPGTLELLAGGNITFAADAKGIVSVGNLINSQKPELGATVSLLAGLQGVAPDWAALMAPLQQTTAAQRDSFAADVLTYVKGIDETVSSEHDALIRFSSLTEQQQSDFASTSFSSVDTRNQLLSASLQLYSIIDALPASGSANKLTVELNELARARGIITQEVHNLRGTNYLSESDALDFFANLDSQRKQKILAEVFSGLDEKAQRGLAEKIYQSLPQANQVELAHAVFFDTLRLAGRNQSKVGNKAYDLGFNAISTVFKGSEYKGDMELTQGKYAGDITLNYSQVYTQDGGNLNFFAPGGTINAGGYAKPVSVSAKEPSELGIVAQSSGSVNAYVYDNVLVNAQRIFTLGGGDITMWASTGNIDAGRGAKSAISAPRPNIRIEDGKVKVDFGGAISGSGIRGILTDPSIKPGDVDLIAPNGEVNAGEAGIGSAGNLTLAARVVVGTDNIDVGGIAVGVPVSDVGGLAAGLSGLSGVTSSTTRAAEDSSGPSSGAQTAESDAALSWLEVTVLGFDDDVSSGYQQPPAPQIDEESGSESRQKETDESAKKKSKKSQQI